MGRVLKFCVHLPLALTVLSGVAVATSFVLAAAKLHSLLSLEWYMVLLPIAVALGIMLVVCTLSVFFWMHAVFWVCATSREYSEREVSLDLLFKTAKMCFLGHGYVTLVSLALGLLVFKIHWRPRLPVVYPLLPIIVLGALYIFMAIMFTHPEVNASWYLFIGMSLLSQSSVLVFKLDHFPSSPRFPWAAVFAPSWLTYACLLAFCVRRGASDIVRLVGIAADDRDIVKSSPRGSPRGNGPASGHCVSTPRFMLQRKLLKITGIACWALGFCIGQVLLTLRLDNLSRVPWVAGVLPMLLGWILLMVFVAVPVSNYFSDMSKLLVSSYGEVPLSPRKDDSDVEQPLLSHRMPWR